jgi:glyoxylase-like metal-dependent hydrolase (beta-lactamase superfamily II)
MTSVRKTHAALEGKPLVTGFFEPRTSSVQYIVADPATQRCAIIDPVLDFDEKSGTTATHSADTLLNHVHSNGLQLEWILDTHPHADHLSAAGYLKERTGAPTAIGAHVVEVQTLWKRFYNLGDNFTADGSQWDHLFDDGERFQIGELAAAVLFSPGHTLASITYRIGDAAFIHDTLFMPDGGTARADFPGGDARQLWHSIEAILALPDQTRLFTGHDYQPGGREPRWESTLGRQRAENAYVKGQDRESFVHLRTERDRKMPMPKLILQSLQVNISGGTLPKPEDNGRRYLKIPLDLFGDVPWS